MGYKCLGSVRFACTNTRLFFYLPHKGISLHLLRGTTFAGVPAERVSTFICHALQQAINIRGLLCSTLLTDCWREIVTITRYKWITGLACCRSKGFWRLGYRAPPQCNTHPQAWLTSRPGAPFVTPAMLPSLLLPTLTS